MTFDKTLDILNIGKFKFLTPPNSFVGEDAVRAMAEERATSVMGTPTMFIDMLQFQGWRMQ